ncbi:MAG: FemAB family XrtA/PEP-CTERM system-associated protein, partial [Gemmatimonadaceae bacterium]
MEAETVDLVAAPAPAAQDVRVRPFASEDESRWEAFVERCPAATFFHRIGWRDILENVFHHRCHYLIAERGGAVCGVLPLAEVRSRLFGHALVSLPFCVYGGPVAEDARAESVLIDASVELAKSLRVEHLELRNRQQKRPHWPRQDLYVTFRKTIVPD